MPWCTVLYRTCCCANSKLFNCDYCVNRPCALRPARVQDVAREQALPDRSRVPAVRRRAPPPDRRAPLPLAVLLHLHLRLQLLLPLLSLSPPRCSGRIRICIRTAARHFILSPYTLHMLLCDSLCSDLITSTFGVLLY